MGEIADDLLDRMLEDGYTYTGRRRPHYEPPMHRLPKDRTGFSDEVRAAEYPSKKTDPKLLPHYPEKTFDMGFFPSPPKAKEPQPFDDLLEGEAPF